MLAHAKAKALQGLMRNSDWQTTKSHYSAHSSNGILMNLSHVLKRTADACVLS